jgi:diguanylate cyclase
MSTRPATNTMRPSSGLTLPTMIHRVRASGFVMGFVIFTTHMLGKDYSPLVWGLMLLQFFAYPHLLHWRTRRAAKPMQAELGNFLIDALVMGLWSAGLGYPLWITFAMLTCNIVSIALYGGSRSGLEAIAIFFGGGLLWVALTGQAVDLHTDWPVSVLCITGLTIFLLMAANTAFHRNRKLQEIRVTLRENEQALHHANAALQQQLLEIHALQDKLHEQVNRDPLTGLYNRRYLDDTLVRELARCQREGRPLSLMLIDLDHFKRINDTYGHQAGDEVLKQLAAMLSAQARSGDVACRFGGEEFLLLLPNMPQAVALERAEQWRQDFAASTIAFGEFRMQVTLSIGLSTYPGHGTSAQALIRSADHALYCAKSEGRNRVVVADLSALMPSTKT